MFQLLLCQQKIILNELIKIILDEFYWNEYKVTPNKVVEIAAVNDVKRIT